MLDDIVIYKYEVGTIINNNRNTICATNDLEVANDFYESTVNKHKDNEKDHIVVFLFDYDINSNINYYDNEFDIY